MNIYRGLIFITIISTTLFGCWDDEDNVITTPVITNLSITNIDSGPGRLGLFSEIKVPKFCKIWGAALPCGLKTNKYHLWLYQTDSVYKKSWTMYEDNGSTNL